MYIFGLIFAILFSHALTFQNYSPIAPPKKKIKKKTTKNRNRKFQKLINRKMFMYFIWTIEKLPEYGILGERGGGGGVDRGHKKSDSFWCGRKNITNSSDMSDIEEIVYKNFVTCSYLIRTGGKRNNHSDNNSSHVFSPKLRWG